ncbi:MAG: arsenate reductase ArsC [Deltaproteobacteria bacterium]|nr:arsenate reductase ArsC [Deltaproteobacteria bacterium]
MKKCSPQKSVLFVCTHNSFRSQMAEALLNKIYGDRYTAFSAGSDPTQIDPLVVSVMSEIGIDVSNYRSKGLNIFKDTKFNCVVTVCDQAKESCPYFPGGNLHLHKGFPDPSGFKGNHEDVINEYRRVRDEIKNWIEKEFG